jgi:hypothetical protein
MAGRHGELVDGGGLTVGDGSPIGMRTVVAVIVLAVAVVCAACSSPTAAPSPSPWAFPVRIDPPQGNLVAVTCSSATFCAALDNVGNVLRYDGTGWHGPIEIASGHYLTAVSCPTSTSCLAVDGAGNAVVNQGTAWSKPVGISCPCHARPLRSAQRWTLRATP